MNTRKNMILLKDEIKTNEIASCRYNSESKKWDVQFTNGKSFSYSYHNVKWLKDPVDLNPNSFRIRREQRDFFDIDAIYVFNEERKKYWHVCFANGSERSYLEHELQIEESCLTSLQSKRVFDYLKQISNLSQVRSMNGEKILPKRYEQIDYVGNETVLARYLNPTGKQQNQGNKGCTPIFPFGCNRSQYKAVKCALENQISVIQGPPGTGKTQTILNILTNILIAGKSVQVVSNNNSATDNVYAKLCDKKYNMGFIVAPLGKDVNKEEFINQQSGKYPDFSSWVMNEAPNAMMEAIQKGSQEVGQVFDLQEELARLKQEISQVELEMKYFSQYLNETSVDIDAIRIRKNISSKHVMLLWQELQSRLEQEKKLGIIFKLKSIFYYGISDFGFYKQDMEKVITSFQGLYYKSKHQELMKRKNEIDMKLSGTGNFLVDEVCSQSLSFLKSFIARKYNLQENRRLFAKEDLWKNADEVLKEYPVILSTTFSARSSLNKDMVYDYVIIDEASQVDVATGALALSCAKNVVIVGDTKQLPNVVTDITKQQSDAIFNSFAIEDGYRFTNSFLKSILDIIPDVPQTLLREHYRCHPKIVNFCNQKFYHGELMIMTQDQGEEDVLSVIKTVEGNHARNHFNQRQIDVILKEVIPKLNVFTDDIGVIAPYRNHVQEMKKVISGIDIDTVHKFQGREKDAIVISTVDDDVTDFSDDPYLINVAVSRARRKLVVVASGNEQTSDGNISDLISYIQYNNFEIQQSNLYSVFDYLYKQYTESRQAFLKTKKRVSSFESENLMYALITEVLQDDRFSSLDVVCHQPLNMLIRNPERLDDRECAYAMNPATHVDFLIFNRISKKPVLAVEVDGYKYHKEGTEQSKRDLMKDRILELYEIPMQRFRTNGSGEKEILMNQLIILIG